MNDTIIDSSILIDFLRGRPEAERFLTTVRAERRLATHAAVVAEVLTGVLNKHEQAAVDELVAIFHLHFPSAQDIELSLDLLRRLRLSHGVGWIDCLIAATALRTESTIATLDRKHFTLFENLTPLFPY